MRELILSTDERCASLARGFTTECLDAAGISESTSFDILLALNEAVANSCRHAYRGPGLGEITIRCGGDGDQLVLTVSDQGSGFSFDALMFEMPDPLSARGRGFFLMRELMDHVEVHTDDLGTVVTMRHKVNDNAWEDNART